jgi:hypothetical protein
MCLCTYSRVKLKLTCPIILHNTKTYFFGLNVKVCCTNPHVTHLLILLHLAWINKLLFTSFWRENWNNFLCVADANVVRKSLNSVNFYFDKNKELRSHQRLFLYIQNVWKFAPTDSNQTVPWWKFRRNLPMMVYRRTRNFHSKRDHKWMHCRKIVRFPIIVLWNLWAQISLPYCYIVFIRGGIQNIPDWFRHLYSSCGSTKHRSQQAKLWIPGYTATFFGDCVKTCEDVAPNFGENRHDCFTMTTPRITLPSSPSRFWRNKKWLSSPSTVVPWFGALWLLPISKNEIEAKRMPVWYHWGDLGRIVESAWHWQKRTSRKRFKNWGDGGTGVYMREGSTSRVMRKIGLMVIFMIFTASVRNIFDTPSYFIKLSLKFWVGRKLISRMFSLGLLSVWINYREFWTYIHQLKSTSSFSLMSPWWVFHCCQQ